MLGRRFLVAGAAASACAIGWGLPVAKARTASARTILRLGLSNARSSQAGQGAVAFARDVARRGGGRVRVELYPFSEAGGELELAQDMVAGAIEMSFVSSAGYANAVLAPKLGVFDIPFLFRDVGHARAVLDGPIGRAALANLDASGVVGLGWGENGLRHMTTAAQSVRAPTDLTGLKIRVPQSEVMVAGFKALGAEPTPMPFPDLYGALASGLVQGQENPLANIKDSNFDQVQKVLSLTGHVYSPALIMINKQIFEALPHEDREVVRSAAAEAVRASREASDKNQQSDIEELRRRGMTIVSDIDRPAFVAAMAPANVNFERLFGKDQIDAIRTFGS